MSENLLFCSKNDDLGIYFINKHKVFCNDKYENICYMNKSSDIYNNKFICDICGKNYFIKYNDINNNSPYINCYKDPENYYLDIIVSFYKLFYFSCKTCNFSGNEILHNCLVCKSHFIYENKILNYKKYYKDTSYLTLAVENKTKLINEVKDNLINNVNYEGIENGKDEILVEDNLVFVFTSTENQKNDDNENNVTMDLGECEDNIKKQYNIQNNSYLYILQIISGEEGKKIPKFEYEVYYPFFGKNNLTKLNLSSCQETKIEISVSVKLDDSLEKYNSRSDYYNDICYKTTSESGTDIPLKTRQNEFVSNNMTLCEENCELIDYNHEKEKAICSCDVKQSLPEDYDIKFDKKDFLKSFVDVKNFANLNILKCYKEVLSKKGLINNYGFYILSFILLLYFITIIIFISKSFRKIKKDIKNIISNLKNTEETKGTNKTKKTKEERKITKPDKEENKIKKRKNNIIQLNLENDDENINKKIIKVNERKKNNTRKEKRKRKSPNRSINNEDKSINMMNKKNIFGLPKLNSKYIKNLMEQKDFELNSLDYEEALLIDKRNFFEYYTSLLKNNHPILFSFAPYKDYNSIIIKFFLFFFSFSLDFTINALFFSDDTMNKIYFDKGKFNFLISNSSNFIFDFNFKDY